MTNFRLRSFCKINHSRDRVRSETRSCNFRRQFCRENFARKKSKRMGLQRTTSIKALNILWKGTLAEFEIFWNSYIVRDDICTVLSQFCVVSCENDSKLLFVKISYLIIKIYRAIQNYKRSINMCSLSIIVFEFESLSKIIMYYYTFINSAFNRASILKQTHYNNDTI